MGSGRGLQRAIGRRPAKLGVNGQRIPVPISTSSDELDEGAIDHYWHPDRDGVESAPDSFATMLAEISPDVIVVRPPAGAPLYFPRAWLVWYRKPAVTHPLSPGWLLLRDWRDVYGQPLPLDQRVFSYLYSVSARVFGSGEKYFTHCVAEMAREKASREKSYQSDRRDTQHDLFDSWQIKNIGAGNKFALHHDGTIYPSRGQQNWSDQTRHRTISGDLAQHEADELDRRREARG